MTSPEIPSSVDEPILYNADCVQVLADEIQDACIDAVVTGPPWGLGFMGEEWDTFSSDVYKQNIKYAEECLLWARALFRVLKPGGHLVAIGANRTEHRMTSSIEDAGFEIRDKVFWAYGEGMPKAMDVSKRIDKEAGAERKVIGFDKSRVRPNRKYRSGAIGKVGGTSTGRVSDRSDNGATITAPATGDARRWQGWATSLKPACEPIVIARKPFEGTVAENVLEYGTGALNIDACRIPVSDDDDIHAKNPHTKGGFGHGDAHVYGDSDGAPIYDSQKGRWPANFIVDEEAGELINCQVDGDPVSRFFYCPKAPGGERDAGLDPGERNDHKTVQPVSLMRHLCRLVTPPGGVVLDPFSGSGTTGIAAYLEGFRYIGIEKHEKYHEIACKRIVASEQHRRGVDGEPRWKDELVRPLLERPIFCPVTNDV